MLAAIDCLRCEPARARFDVVALAPKQGRLADELSERGISNFPLQLRDPTGVRLPREQVCDNLLKAVRESSADLVHANSLSMGRLSGFVAEELAVPSIVHLRDIIKLSLATVRDLNQNRLLLAVSEATKAFHGEQGLDVARIRVLLNGVDCDRFQPRPSHGILKQELGLPENAFLAATVGQIGLRKGQDVLAEAAILAARRLPNVHYLLVGERNSSKAESIAFERNVIFRFDGSEFGNQLHRLGYRNNVPRLMNEFDLLIHHARQEPLGRVLLEAAASGVPIIATRVGGTAEILSDGESARLIPPDNPHALAEAILELHDQVDQRSRFIEAARRRVCSAFPIERAAGNLATVWAELAG